MSDVLQFQGGPRDGEQIAVQDGAHYVRITFAPPPARAWDPTPVQPMMPSKFRTGWYRRCSCPNCRCLHWEGEE